MKKTWLGWKGYRTNLSAAADGDFAYGQDNKLEGIHTVYSQRESQDVY